jgi:hypothetical protein
MLGSCLHAAGRVGILGDASALARTFGRACVSFQPLFHMCGAHGRASRRGKQLTKMVLCDATCGCTWTWAWPPSIAQGAVSSEVGGVRGRRQHVVTFFAKVFCATLPLYMSIM